MAKPPCARLTKPIRPIVTDRPTETMNRTMPAATPPRSMLATSTPKITWADPGGLGGPSRTPQLQSEHPAHRSTLMPSRDGGLGGPSRTPQLQSEHPAHSSTLMPSRDVGEPPKLLSRARPDLLLLAGVL